MQRRLCERLEALAGPFRAAGEVSADEFLQTIEVMTMIESYYTPEQMEALKRRREQLGEDAIRAAEADWAELIAQITAEMENGHRPGRPEGAGAGTALAGAGERLHRRRPGDRAVPRAGCGRSRGRTSRLSSAWTSIRTSSNTLAGARRGTGTVMM